MGRAHVDLVLPVAGQRRHEGPATDQFCAERLHVPVNISALRPLDGCHMQTRNQPKDGRSPGYSAEILLPPYVTLAQRAATTRRKCQRDQGADRSGWLIIKQGTGRRQPLTNPDIFQRKTPRKAASALTL